MLGLWLFMGTWYMTHPSMVLDLVLSGLSFSLHIELAKGREGERWANVLAECPATLWDRDRDLRLVASLWYPPHDTWWLSIFRHIIFLTYTLSHIDWWWARQIRNTQGRLGCDRWAEKLSRGGWPFGTVCMETLGMTNLPNVPSSLEAIICTHCSRAVKPNGPVRQAF